jgi:hypothetical protein
MIFEVEEIVDDEITATSTPSSNPSQSCAHCNAPAQSRCSSCKIAYYCSPEHQRKDNKSHKHLCPLTFPAALPNHTISLYFPVSGPIQFVSISTTTHPGGDVIFTDNVLDKWVKNRGIRLFFMVRACDFEEE